MGEPGAVVTFLRQNTRLQEKAAQRIELVDMDVARDESDAGVRVGSSPQTVAVKLLRNDVVAIRRKRASRPRDRQAVPRIREPQPRILRIPVASFVST